MRQALLGSVVTLVVVLTGCDTGEMVNGGTVVREEAKGTLIYNFDRDRAGELPAAWAIHHTHAYKAPAVWKVEEDRSAPAGRT